ncbi:MAG: glycosyl hydrolase [Bacteroidota bacterium]
MAYSKSVLEGFPLTAENFADPPLEMGILPFWFWNGMMDEREMEWQLRQYHAKGIRSLFIHGRFGLKVPYVSDAWFRKVKVAVDLARRIGIDAWVYDEMNWPSGTAERKVPKTYPHLTQKYLELVALNVDGPLFTFLEATDNRYVNTGDSYPVAAFGCTEEEFQTVIRNPIDLTQNLSFERVIPWEAPPGKWRLLYFLQKEVPYYIDTLNPESTRRFIEFTHDRYKKAVGEHFGNVVPGFYTDEPAMHYYHVGIDNYVIPWTSRMFKIFRERRGYDLRPWLPALYLNMGKKTATVRYDFWRTLTEQYAETYYGQIREWCEKNGVLFTGHLLFEEWLRMHARCEGNLFRYLEKMHVVGVDHLYPKVGTKLEPDQHVAIKVASSAAHHFGSTRLLCESMGGSYWDCSLERMKWIANWEYVLGVNLFNNHGYHYSIEGERKRDWPPSQFYHHTWWKYYDRFTTYMARLSHLLSGGRHVARVAVLYPINSIWANYVPQQRTAVGNATEFDFNYLTDALLRLHYDFDYIDEDVLAGASIRGGKIRVRDEEYSLLILPPVTHIKRSTYEAIREFTQSGGTVIGDTLLPVEFLESGDGSAQRKVRRLFGVDPDGLLRSFEKGGNERVRTVHRNGKGVVFVLEGMGLHGGSGEKELAGVLRRCVTPDVTVGAEEVFYLHRVKDGLDIYFFANTSQNSLPEVAITLESRGVPELWDVNTGAARPLPVYTVKGGRTAFSLDFPPAESHVVVVRPTQEKFRIDSTNMRVRSFDGATVVGSAAVNASRVYADVVERRKKTRWSAKARRPLRPIILHGPWSFVPEGDNALLIDRFRMAIDDGSSAMRKAHLPEVDDNKWLRVLPGAWEMQLPQERDAATYPVRLWFRAVFDAAVVPASLRLLIDGFSGSAYRLYMNGEEIRERGTRSTLDAEMKEVAIGRHIRQGRNVIAIQLTAVRRTDGILDPLKLLGDFALDESAEGLRIIQRLQQIAPADWTGQGYPFFSGTGVYATEFTLPASHDGGCLTFEAECGEDVLELWVNGTQVAVAPWHPYRIDVSSHLHAGNNTVAVKVTNTLINILEGVRKASGLLAPPIVTHEHLYAITKHRGR